MPAEIIRDAKVQIDSFDLGNLVKSCTVNYTVPTQEVTGMGDTSKRYVTDISEWNAEIEFYDDFTDNGLNEKIWTWVTGAAEIAFKARKADTTISASNPEFQGNVLLLDAPVFGAGVGQVAGGRLRLQGSGALTRAVS